MSFVLGLGAQPEPTGSIPEPGAPFFAVFFPTGFLVIFGVRGGGVSPGGGCTTMGESLASGKSDILPIYGDITMCLFSFLASGCPAPLEREISFGNLPLSEGIPSVPDGMTFQKDCLWDNSTDSLF